MACMKCGKKLGRSQTFCDECLDKMAQCPVAPNVVVRLPERPAVVPTKKKQPQRRYFWYIENEIGPLRTKVRWLTFALIVAIISFLIAVAMVFVLLYWEGDLDVVARSLPF